MGLSIHVRSDYGAVVVAFAGTVDASMLDPLRGPLNAALPATPSPFVRRPREGGGAVDLRRGRCNAVQGLLIDRVSSDDRGLLAVSRHRAERVHREDNWRAST